MHFILQPTENRTSLLKSSSQPWLFSPINIQPLHLIQSLQSPGPTRTHDWTYNVINLLCSTFVTVASANALHPCPVSRLINKTLVWLGTSLNALSASEKETTARHNSSFFQVNFYQVHYKPGPNSSTTGCSSTEAEANLRNAFLGSSLMHRQDCFLPLQQQHRRCNPISNVGVPLWEGFFSLDKARSASEILFFPASTVPEQIKFLRINCYRQLLLKHLTFI